MPRQVLDHHRASGHLGPGGGVCYPADSGTFKPYTLQEFHSQGSGRSDRAYLRKVAG